MDIFQPTYQKKLFGQSKFNPFNKTWVENFNSFNLTICVNPTKNLLVLTMFGLYQNQKLI